MPNILDRYFEEAIKQIVSEPNIPDKDLPQPEHPQYNSFNPAEFASSNDILIPLREGWTDEVSNTLLGDRENLQTISKDQRELLDGGVREFGFEVYAFYKSRRHVASAPYPKKWGIFYLEHGLSHISKLIEETYPGYGSPLRFAYEFLREHERFHFKFDLYALSVEANIRRALYDPLKRAFRNHRIYQVEEALANRDAWDWARKKKVGLEDFAEDFMKLQPGAYARFDEDKFELSSELAANLIDLNLTKMARRDDQSLWVANIPEKLMVRSLCPEYVVRTASLAAWISAAWRMPIVSKINEEPSFTKLIETKYSSLQERWVNTKSRLMDTPALPGLEFKCWDKSTGVWSVKVNRNFRAHLRSIPRSDGIWEAIEFGPHKAMGHG